MFAYEFVDKIDNDNKKALKKALKGIFIINRTFIVSSEIDMYKVLTKKGANYRSFFCFLRCFVNRIVSP